MKLLQQIREARNWSKLEAARRARIAPGTYGQIESGRYIPYDVELERRGGRVRLDSFVLFSGDEPLLMQLPCPSVV